MPKPGLYFKYIISCGIKDFTGNRTDLEEVGTIIEYRSCSAIVFNQQEAFKIAKILVPVAEFDEVTIDELLIWNINRNEIYHDRGIVNKDSTEIEWKYKTALEDREGNF